MALRQKTVPILTTAGPRGSCAGSSDRRSSGDSPEEAEEFQDATEYHPTYDMDLHISFEDCEVAIHKFFNNDLVGAMNIMRPWARTSLYHSLGASIFEFIPAMLTFDHEQIGRSIVALKQCITICNKNRKSFSLVESLGTIIKKPNYALYTDLEAHAELCYAEALLLQAAMTIMEGEDLTGLIKGTIKVKSCYNTYKECSKILEKKQWDTDESKRHFQSGVRLGMATFNVMISLLPPKIISLLEFVGFSGNKALGLSELQAASRSPGMRSVLCDLTLLGYHLVICHFVGASGDLKVCEEILEKILKIYPESVWFLVFKGRLEFLRGLFEPAISTYNCALNSQHNFKQFRHLCFWEIMWVNSLKMEWREAAQYATKLMDESSWSRTIYSYTKAAMLLQLGSDMTPNEKHQCNELLRNCSFYKQRIAGKSLPMEKFMIKRAARYYTQGGRLVLPAIELLCLWNMFGILTYNSRGAQYVLKVIEVTRERVEDHRFDWMGIYIADNRALLRYMHGCCLAAMGLPRLALNSFDAVFQLKSEIKEDTFLFPYTVVEVAMCHYQLGDKDKAVQLLNEARRKYSGYSLESRLHFRIHSKMDLVKADIAAEEATKTASKATTVTTHVQHTTAV
ncbi:tetratricopeptide repeat protein 39B-like [Bombyx mandarina]|uniref:Tetratricopeptide repeat protein 39B n=2 Tax=Bombyx TaxID=7090 RepID=A0A8R2AQB7_BOMMO|nr:tetratricopeptide repeat protein 39B isoform X2 [Bombyx mori]XP_028032985.1 tetratricopeptide repeat protein 39B-like [Bombyx mandarina]XP_028032986.1 tetratricopeptide repeat protein 39B-like [Bombyx mandarina]XP_028032987.1 tetratricopeptide repeat protein 39B-like [Bombyx mandarina]XP_028032988.1 tetratricopeptide repeat protein 39B-like [Bombyx mandarina]